MSKYKMSFYNINLVEDSYVRGTNEGITPYYNIRTGKFGYIPDDVDFNNPPQTLLQDGFIIPSHIDEQESYRQAQITAITDDYPNYVFLCVCPSTKCNYRCEYCFQGTHEHGVDMKDEVLKDTIAYIKNEIDRNPNLKAFQIKWFGGEPLLNMSAIREISKFVIPYCDNKNISYTAIIVTNGYLYTKAISEELKVYRVNLAQIAIDGTASDYASVRKVKPDAYTRVLQNIEDSVIPVSIRVNVNKQNIGKFDEIITELSNLQSVKEGRNRLHIARVKEYSNPLKYGFSDRDWIEFRKHQTKYQDVFPVVSPYEKTKIIPCPYIQKRNLILSADGLLYRCDFHIGNSKYSIGTIKNGVNKNNSVDKNYIRSTITDSCMKCKYLPICAGGLCRFAELKRGKDCELVKGRFKQNMQNYLTYVSPI